MDSPSENGVSTNKQTDIPVDENSVSSANPGACGNSASNDKTHLHANGDIEEIDTAGTTTSAVSSIAASTSTSTAPAVTSAATTSAASASDSNESNGSNENLGPIDGSATRPTTNGSFPSVYPNQNAANEAAVRHGYRGNVDAERILYGNLQGATAAATEGPANGRRRMTSKTNVYVSGLKPTDTQESLASLVHPRLAPKSVTVVSDKDGRSQGYGFLDFKSEEESRAAIEMIKNNNPKFVVRLANESEKDKTNLYLRGLPRNDSYDEEDLSAAFRNFGEVVSVKIMTERNPSPGNQQPRTGIGFVRFQNEDDARRALERINENKEHIIIKGERVNVEAKYADKQVGRIHSNHNSHPTVTTAGSNHSHAMGGGTRAMPQTVPLHGGNLGWNLMNGGQHLGVYPPSLAAANVFRNFHSMTGMPAQNGLIWPSNGTGYLHHPEGWNESNLAANVNNLSLTNNIGSINNDSHPETTHAPTNAGQVALTQANQSHGNDPNPAMSHANLPNANPVVLSRHPSTTHPNSAVEWMNSHPQHHMNGPEHTNGRGRHGNNAHTPPQQPPTPQAANQGTGQAIPIQQQLGPNSNGFNPNAFFNAANSMSYNHQQTNGFIPMVPAPVSIHQTEGGYQLTPGGCVFYGTPPIYSSSQIPQNGNGHILSYNGAAQNAGSNMPNHTALNMLSYPQNQSALQQWATLAANNGLAQAQYYQAHPNGYQVCPYPQSQQRLPNGPAQPNPQNPQAPTPNAASGNGANSTAAQQP